MRTSGRLYDALQGSPDHANAPWPISSHSTAPAMPEAHVIFVIDGNVESQDELRETLQARDYAVETFSDCAAFLKAHRPRLRGCLLIDTSTGGGGELDLIRKMGPNAGNLASIAISSRFTLTNVVDAMKAGVSDCLERPMVDKTLFRAIERAINEIVEIGDAAAFRALAVQRVELLTARQREILDLITAGHPSKNIAADLNISQRTVENHRAAIARKTCSKSLSDVVHTAVCANCTLVKAQH